MKPSTPISRVLALAALLLLPLFLAAQRDPSAAHAARVSSAQNALSVLGWYPPQPRLQHRLTKITEGKREKLVFLLDSTVYRSNPTVVLGKPVSMSRASKSYASTDSLGRIFRTNNMRGIVMYYRGTSDTIESIIAGASNRHLDLVFENDRLIYSATKWLRPFPRGYLTMASTDPAQRYVWVKYHHRFTYDAAGRVDSALVDLVYGTAMGEEGDALNVRKPDSVRVDSIRPHFYRALTYDPEGESTLKTTRVMHVLPLSLVMKGTTAYRITARGHTRIDTNYGAEMKESKYEELDYDKYNNRILERRRGHPDQSGYVMERFTWKDLYLAAIEKFTYGSPGELQEWQVARFGEGYTQPASERTASAEDPRKQKGILSIKVFDGAGNFLRIGEVDNEWVLKQMVYPEK